jgi:hypothetical protein
VITVLYADRGQTYRVLLRARYRASGTWTATAGYRSGRRWEVRWRNAQGTTFTGPPTAAYAF